MAHFGIERYAEHIISKEMRASSKIFDRVAEMRYDQLGDATHVLASDFGFRAAVATHDAPTIDSVLDSLRHRLHSGQAFVVTTDGEIIGYRGTMSTEDADAIFSALDGGAERGVLSIDDETFNAAASPIKALVLMGWVVFANRFDGGEIGSLGAMSEVGLKPEVVPVARLPEGLKVAAVGSIPPAERTIDGERILMQASPIQSFADGSPQALLLEYSLTRALSDYTPMLWLLLSSGLSGLVIVAVGSWLLARRITRPVKKLEQAARNVSAGEYAQVPIETRDELGMLAQSFNRMVDDIGERERQIAHMAFHDSLTGLANRALFREHLAMALARPDRGRRQALLCLDLDQFKVINDTLGHPTGDALLCEVARRLEALCSDGFVARLGGDEFAIIVEEGDYSIDRIAKDVLETVRGSCTVNGHRLVPTTSIGIAVIGQDGDDVTALLKNADLALYRAKSDGRGGFRFFEEAMDAEAHARRQMELDLHDAIQHGELALMFQPLFNLAESRVSAFEALLRWHHPKRGTGFAVGFHPARRGYRADPPDRRMGDPRSLPCRRDVA